MKLRIFALLAPVVFFGAALAGCERPPPADKAKEWAPSDHDRAEEGSGASGAQAAPQAPPRQGDGGGATRPSGVEQLVEMTWQENCLQCHGPIGKGDGPTGPMVKASDLTREEWQARVTDADIASVITNGKARMPKFDLPPKVVEGLVARIRASRGR